MISHTVRKKICAGQIILYLRASTEPQATASFPDQVDTIRSIYPEFSVARSTIIEISEVMSGLADAEIRLVTGLGEALDQLERHSDSILLVSKGNRLARRADVFELIQSTGLGHRIYDATTGLCLNDMIKLGSHISIEKQINAQLAKGKEAIARLMQDGGSMGYDSIARHSAEGSEKKKRLAQERKAQVFSVISQVTINARGKTPTHKEICSELGHQGVHTGQRRPFTPSRLAHLKKSDRRGWDYAFDSYRRPRRNIRASVTAAQTKHVMRRTHKRHLRLFLSVMTDKSKLLTRANPRAYCRQTSLPHRPRKAHSMTGCHDGCRGPPDTSYTACAAQMQS